jgi:hypothetical protein
VVRAAEQHAVLRDDTRTHDAEHPQRYAVAE